MSNASATSSKHLILEVVDLHKEYRLNQQAVEVLNAAVR